MMKRIGIVLAVLALAACGGGGSSSAPGPVVVNTPVSTPAAPVSTLPPGVSVTPTPMASPGATATPAGSATTAPLPLALNVDNLSGTFYGEIVAQFSHVSPRNLVMLPNGDLLVGTGGGTASFAQSGQIYIVPSAESAVPAAPSAFATLADTSCASSGPTNTNGIAFAPGSGGGTIFVGMECSVWSIAYHTGDRVASAAPAMFARVRTGPPPAAGDGDVHHTTTVLAAGSSLYVSVGSSCNACTETDTTRATVQTYDLASHAALTPAAVRVRNALALARNPATGTVWAGGAGQDCVTGAMCFAASDPLYVTNGHPYEWLDPMTKHTAPADYEWPWCEENKTAVPTPDGTVANLGPPPVGTNCATMIVAPVRAPAYSTIMSAVFYAPPNGATYAFPSAYNGGLFFTMHGSWHEDTNGNPVAVPQVAFVPMSAGADAPAYPMDWSANGSPYSTWARNTSGNPAPFMNGFQSAGTRIGRPAGLAVGTSGSLFISDDAAGVIYRIRPGTAPQSVKRAPTAASPSRR